MRPDFETAARTGDVAALTRLLDAGADVNARDAHGQTAVMLAAMEGHAGAITLLASRGANLDHTAKYRLTALMLAVIRGHEAAARALAEAGADRSLRGSGAPGFDGLTAADLARARGLTDLADALSPASP